MCSLKILTVLLVATYVLAGPISQGCSDPTNEEQCRKEDMKKFFTEFSAGNADLEVKPMDPMVLDEIDVAEETVNLIFHYKQFKVTGLKDVVVEDFSKEKDSNVAHMVLKWNYVADSPMDIQFVNKDKVLSGNVKYEVGVTGTITYPFSTNKREPVIGQETLTCETTNIKSTINDELKKALETDPDAKAINEQYLKIHKQHQEKVACETTKAVLKVVVENLRALVKNEKH